MKYIGLTIAYIGGFMGLYSNYKQPEFDIVQGFLSVTMLIAAFFLNIWIWKTDRKNETK